MDETRVRVATAKAYNARGCKLFSLSSIPEEMVVATKTVAPTTVFQRRRMIAYWRVRYAGTAADVIVVTRWGMRTRTGRDPLAMMTGRETRMLPSSPLRPKITNVTRDGKIGTPYAYGGYVASATPPKSGVQWVSSERVETPGTWEWDAGVRVEIIGGRVFRQDSDDLGWYMVTGECLECHGLGTERMIPDQCGCVMLLCAECHQQLMEASR